MHLSVYWSVNQHAASTSNPMYPHQMYCCNILLFKPMAFTSINLGESDCNYDHNHYL